MKSSLKSNVKSNIKSSLKYIDYILNKYIMNIVLFCLKNFQEYILYNIEQLIKLGHKNIYVITNPCFNFYFEKFSSNIRLINVNELEESYNFVQHTSLDKNFRNGFWALTSLRFFYIYEFMKKYQIKDVIHLENDVLLYYNCDKIIDKFDKNYVYIPFDTYNRNIASIMYIPNADIFKKIMDKYDFNKNDMENFSNIKKQTGIIHNLPIFIQNNSLSNEEKFVSENFHVFSCIFDAAAIGQYLGGIDPNNNPNDTTGFVNETCVIKYNNYKIWFEEVDNIKRPFIEINDNKYEIFNLHIHCKNLKKFM